MTSMMNNYVLFPGPQGWDSAYSRSPTSRSLIGFLMMTVSVVTKESELKNFLSSDHSNVQVTTKLLSIWDEHIATAIPGYSTQ